MILPAPTRAQPPPPGVATEPAVPGPRPSPSEGGAVGADDLDLRAETVRDYLVSLRGGAPFLSGEDDRLLLSWLEAGLPVARILAAVDAVADRRRRQKSRRRLTLAACKKAVESGGTGSAGPAPSAREGPAVGGEGEVSGPGAPLAALAREIEASALPPALEEAGRALVAELRAVARSPAHPDELGRTATAAIARFHAAAWAAAAAEHAALHAQAEARLAALRTLVTGAEWQDLVEEAARDLLRQRIPAVSARAVWDRLAP